MKFNLNIRKEKKLDRQNNWIDLNNIDQVNDIKKLSAEHPVVIFKHSTRCLLSSRKSALVLH